MNRPCLDCGALVPYPATRCPVHRSARWAHRGTTASRGYGAAHQAARRTLASMLPGPCGYGCGTTLYPGDDWVAAHAVDGQPEFGWLASCRSCNERAKQR